MTRDENSTTGETLLGQLIRTLLCGVRVAFFREVPAGELRAGPGVLVALAAVDGTLNLGASLLLVGGDGGFTWPALSSFLFHLPLLLLFGVLAARLLELPTLVTGVPAVLIALSLPLELSHALLEVASGLPRFGWLADHLAAPHYFRFFGWWSLAAACFLARLAPTVPRRRGALLLFFLGIIVIPLWIFPRSDLWVGTSGTSESGTLHLTDEVLAVQNRLMEKALAGLRSVPAGEGELYFVGFAGDATQDVFTREVTAVENLFTSRFDTAGRTVVLANNPATASSLPFATGRNLEAVLERVGAVMDRDRDILFLYLTSHGLAEHALVVDNPPLELTNLTPAALRRMLDRSGITWRVIVVSACYAGGFLDPLADDHTLVITAADADHASFGCDYGEEFTWFGQAYFDDALRRTTSFADAFVLARETIDRWERREGETPSNPQIRLGAAMAEHLAHLERRWKDRGGASTGTIP